MKQGLLYSVVALAAIVIVASFNMQLGDPAVSQIPESMIDKVLYVCPSADSTWTTIATSLRPFTNYIFAGFFFGLVLLLFGWGWQLYQNMLDDKFKRESFKNIWTFTKWFFWAIVIIMLVIVTPNNFRRVSISGAGDQWVLCDANTAGARAVKADAVHAH
ncbi:MAG: hypothetical protein IKP05_02820 [Alphaproteobacteria bacterium]|nr:hypothetical protein [Alphaproteobacteria bacterium]